MNYKKMPLPLRLAVVSIGRSGTSLVSRILDHVLGIDFGDEADHIPRNHSNPDGYFENAAFMAFNIRLLESVGASVLAPPPRGFADRLPPETRAGWVREARDLLSRYAPSDASFGWKDPRLSFTLPIWRAACPALAAIVPFRNPRSVMSSIAEQLDCPVAALAGLWRTYYAHVFDATEAIPRLLVDFDALLADPAAATASMAQFCGAPLEEGAMYTALAGIVKPQQSRHSPDTNKGTTGIALDAPTQQLYDFLRTTLAQGKQPTNADFFRVFDAA